MEQYIPKSALVAEIERRRDLHYKYYMKNGAGSIAECKYDEDRDILSFIDTLEVKEVDVDVEKEFSKWWKGERAKDYNVDTLYERYSNTSLKLAKHFFKLGLKAQKEVDLEKDVRQILSLYYEGIKHYEDIIKEEREENGGSDLAIKIMDGVIDARELAIQYVIDKLKAQKGEEV